MAMVGDYAHVFVCTANAFANARHFLAPSATADDSRVSCLIATRVPLSLGVCGSSGAGNRI